jgi:hypothetical protein
MNARLDAAALSVLAQPYITQARVDGRLWAELQDLLAKRPPYKTHGRNGMP